jgi:DNA mismatch repair ATPase MutS
MASLATLAHANPDWCYPEVTAASGPGVMSGVDVAHPLIAREVRVGNDVSVGPRGTFLLVTGSNMSGKSTLLRTIGLNTVLAQAGGPVCARSFRMPSVVLATSVQVQDSLAQGVSRFMAELLRLREVVELVRALQRDDAPLPLYLLDEILQGTNTAERQVGARMVVRQLLSLRCIGVVTTHDLALADSPDLDSAARKVHFTEGVEEQHGQVVLSFEYKLKPGIATSVNALKLMKAVGLAD